MFFKKRKKVNLTFHSPKFYLQFFNQLYILFLDILETEQINHTYHINLDTININTHLDNNNISNFNNIDSSSDSINSNNKNIIKHAKRNSSEIKIEIIEDEK